jgi:hypothetical protein
MQDFFASQRPHKSEVKQVSLAVGGNLVNYLGKVSTHTDEMSTAKALFSSVFLIRHGRFSIVDLKIFYLGTAMQWYKYMSIHISTIPDSSITHYNLLYIFHNGYFLLEIMKGMYGLLQPSILAYE